MEARKKWIYFFGEASIADKTLLGGKGAGLAEMTMVGLHVPPGFTITTEACVEYYRLEKSWPDGLATEIQQNLEILQTKTGKIFGNPKQPLLVSVRSGAKVSMPGMMDTVLNLGINDAVAAGIARVTNNERFAYDCYRRFLQMFGSVVMGVPHEMFEESLESVKRECGAKEDTQLTPKDWKKVVGLFKDLIQEQTGRSFPADPQVQLELAVHAVFKSWKNNRAMVYRNLNGIPHSLGTAVVVQAMVFGNMGYDSATGVAFTRNPSNGEKLCYGEYLVNAQGEDVVEGFRTPHQLEDLQSEMPRVYDQMMSVTETLERHYRDALDIEFTIERGQLFILQLRIARRSSAAAIKIAMDMACEGLISRKEALLRVEPRHIDQLLHKQLDEGAKKSAKRIARGLPASPGAAVGVAVFSAAAAVVLHLKNVKTILVRTETSPEDIEGMNVCVGLLSSRGGMTSHAAVVARGMNKICVAGCDGIQVFEKDKKFVAEDVVVVEGEVITLDGSTGEVFLGELPVTDVDVEHAPFLDLLKWGDAFKRMAVRTNADTPADAAIARTFGAEGIGLVRTEHMFFESSRITAMREMIIADSKESRAKALDKLLPFQQSDFEGLFSAMDGLPVVVRLFDPPLHEFLPHTEPEMAAVAAQMGCTVDKIRAVTQQLKEFNPMLGFRGCRVALVHQDIAEMQIRAVFRAALAVSKKGVRVFPEIEVALVGHVKEFVPLKSLIRQIAKEEAAEGVITYKVGTMIEVPRAALTANQLAVEADFFSFGTNDLTQMCCGFSRDDSQRFLRKYSDMGIYPVSPFETIDEEGVGQLMKICVSLGRSVKSDLLIGICGEHGGDPSTVEFCHRIGLSYVSCSPWRVPLARLAAAQAAIRESSTAETEKSV